MGWLWTLQIMVDIALIASLWKLLRERGERIGGEPGRVETTLRREDFEQYHEALSDLCDRMRREGEGWVNQLEQKTRTACQVIQRLEEAPERGGQAPVAAPRRREQGSGAPSAVAPPGSATREEVLYLRSQGHTVEQIARQLQLGQREVQLLLSLQQR